MKIISLSKDRLSVPCKIDGIDDIVYLSQGTNTVSDSVVFDQQIIDAYAEVLVFPKKKAKVTKDD
jgi:hypothetical protein